MPMKTMSPLSMSGYGTYQHFVCPITGMQFNYGIFPGDREAAFNEQVEYTRTIIARTLQLIQEITESSATITGAWVKKQLER